MRYQTVLLPFTLIISLICSVKSPCIYFHDDDLSRYISLFMTLMSMDEIQGRQNRNLTRKTQEIRS